MKNQTFCRAADAVDYAEAMATLRESTMLIAAHDDGYVVKKAGRHEPAFVIERVHPVGESFGGLKDRFYRLIG